MASQIPAAQKSQENNFAKGLPNISATVKLTVDSRGAGKPDL